MAKVKDYLRYLEKGKNNLLFREECRGGFANIAEEFGELETQETIQEIHLSDEARECDYSIKIDYPQGNHVKNYWYELDDTACGKRPVLPCYFIDAEGVKRGEDHAWIYENFLSRFMEAEAIESLKPVLEHVIESGRGEVKSFFQFGVMAGRGQSAVRVFSLELKKEEVSAWLETLAWRGNQKVLQECLEELESYAEKKEFIIDFDVTQQGISSKIGINFGSRDKKRKTISDFLGFLKSKGLALDAKIQGTMNWIERRPSANPFIMNDISHFKLPFDGEKITGAKAYLRQSQNMYTEPDAFEHPVLMNLELTTRCPLHCPQCYCQLEGGRDLSLSEAEKWLKEAAANGVCHVNLSGGETMCYPHIFQVTEIAAGLGLRPNIAVSGYHFGREEVRRFVHSGIENICVSLNASCQECNALTRDGYDLAIRALQALKDEKFERTCINWVMHNSNADDFEELVKLAEEYNVSEVDVMVFKPDARNQRNTLPTLEQMRNTAAFIKQYKGQVKIEAEPCFSQMRALLGERFFVNLNRGIQKGCGAGRDGISVSVDGRLTPCRHLDVREEFDSIEEYWNCSPLLQKLRKLENNRKEPCDMCGYRQHCRPCAAVGYKLNQEWCLQDEFCELWREKDGK